RCRTAALGRDSKMLYLAGGDARKITCEIVADAWHAGDSVAEVVLRETAGLLAIWLGNVIDLLEPDVIVVGGGVGELMSEWFDFIHAVLPKWSVNQRCGEIPLILGKYKADAGIAGAAALFMSDAARQVVSRRP
ncbi:MAG TPA: ROK family protein, partial [Coriobacteriia bacterium]